MIYKRTKMTSGEGQADQGLQGSHPTVLIHFGVWEGASTTTGQKRMASALLQR